MRDWDKEATYGIIAALELMAIIASQISSYISDNNLPGSLEKLNAAKAK